MRARQFGGGGDNQFTLSANYFQKISRVWRGGESSLEVEVDWFNVQLLRHHDPSHDGVDEE